MTSLIRRLSTTQPTFDDELSGLLAWNARESEHVAETAAGIVDAVREEGDAALLRLTREYDGLQVDDPAQLQLDPKELQDALHSLAAADRQALEDAAGRIRDYHERQPSGGFEYQDEHGNWLGQRVTPLDRVGLYVPGGQASYPSTVLMTAIPAQVAGVGELIATVPTPNGQRSAHVLAALHLAGVQRVFSIGGAQAIAALAWGTATVPRVDKVVGPGGAFVAAAKRLVFGPVGIDLIAGPSEVLIIADGSVPEHWVAWDLLAQAEHDAAAQALLLCPDAGYLDRVYKHIEECLPELPRGDVVRASLGDRGALVLVRDLAEACRIANRFAPEHLQLAVRDADAWLPNIRHAGAIFAGGWCAEVLGDYSAGPSHVLPTYGTARYASPLSVLDFQKRTSIIRSNANSARPLAAIAANIAAAEGLSAHAAAARVRMAANTADVAVES